jgi:hypothetical protein
LFVYDYLRNRWSEWKINAAGGLCEFNDLLVIAERRKSALTSDIANGHFEENVGDNGIFFQDHDQPISFRYGSAWYTGGRPSIPKQFPRIRVSSVPTTENNTPQLDVRQQVNFIRSDRAEVTIDLGIQTAPFQVVAQSRLVDGKYRSTRLILENEVANENVQIEGWEMEVDGSYIEELKT